MSANEQTWLYFGCVDRPGHHLRDERLNHVSTYGKYHRLDHFDGLLPPRDSALYIASFSRLGGWGMSAIAFWDKSVDKRDGCNSVFFVNSLTITPEEMLVEAKKRFPDIFKRFPQEVKLHRDVVKPVKPTQLVYPAKFVISGDGACFVSFRDIPEALTQGDDLNDGIDMAQDALVTAFDFYFEDNREVPMPSPFQYGEMAIRVPVEMTERVFQHNAKL